jgi:hypothetical protein
MSHSVLARIESLFLGTRALPGIWLPSQIPSWPGFDDLTFAGDLAPNEVQALSEIIEDFNGAHQGSIPGRICGWRARSQNEFVAPAVQPEQNSPSNTSQEID